MGNAPWTAQLTRGDGKRLKKNRNTQSGPSQQDVWKDYARRMVEEQVRDRGVTHEATLAALLETPRHAFAPEAALKDAYGDFPLPIGYNQTISQPYIVGVMTDLLRLRPTDRVLEIGLGSGYQAAILSRLAAEVHSVEIIPELERTARERLERLGCRNVYTHVGNGEQGWPEAAPYDAILLTAAPAQVPPALFTQLKPGRRLVAPVGATGSQVLMVYTKTEKGQIDRERIFEVRFVPLLAGWP